MPSRLLALGNGNLTPWPLLAVPSERVWVTGDVHQQRNIRVVPMKSVQRKLNVPLADVTVGSLGASDKIAANEHLLLGSVLGVARSWKQI